MLNEVSTKPVKHMDRTASMHRIETNQNPIAFTKKIKNEDTAVPSPVETPFFSPAFLASFKQALYLWKVSKYSHVYYEYHDTNLHV